MHYGLNLRPILDVLLGLFYPNICISCGKLFKSTPSGICTNCRAQLNPTRLGDWKKELTCSTGIDSAYTGWYLDSQLQSVIHSTKYQELPKFAFNFGRLLAEELITMAIPDQVDYLVPVPLHPVKQRERGYNQSLWIARGLSRIWQIPVEPKIARRQRYTATQTTLSAVDRRKNVAGAFRIMKPVAGQRFALIDDVLTTGSTLSALAQTFKQAGAKKVVSITLATPRLNQKQRNTA